MHLHRIAQASSFDHPPVLSQILNAPTSILVSITPPPIRSIYASLAHLSNLPAFGIQYPAYHTAVASSKLASHLCPIEAYPRSHIFKLLLCTVKLPR
ncbi:hypothetical protein CBS147343_1712 [Aspergillus niger]|nr:hypothetical protein CBS12448_3758 [Aspergillus niger]KAI2925921.1 hypothetical protein CBS147371_292 [Aspergillus niger]KAI2991103.1 hypothetical protein CBS147344_1885 [Aspergillus niger]KAI3002177.1 hypothetical protein CBS147482_6723 [Aspergillus niger]KAI3088945.1 hypothetical protein CBS147343_1712 [Aspergillus niger]